MTAGDPDLVAFLQRVAGYALTGTVREHALFFFYGTGRNGKGVFLNTLTAVLADYAVRLEQVVVALGAGETDEPPWTVLREAFLTVGEDYETERDELLRRFRIVRSAPSVAARNLQLQAMWEEAAAEAASDLLGVEVDQDIRSRLIAGSAMAAMRASLHRWLTTDGDSRLPDHIVYCFDLLGAGLEHVNQSK